MRSLLAAIRREKGDIDTNLSSRLSLLASAASAGCDLADPDGAMAAGLPDWRPGTLIVDIPG